MRLKCLAVGIALLVAIGVWPVGACQEPAAKKEGGPNTADLLQHGDYLVNAALLCGDCHTPQDDRGQPDRSRRLHGGTLTIRPKKETKDWVDEAPDITGGGLAGMWSEEEMVKFLSTGTDPDGMRASPPMPRFRLNARDARAVTLYLKSLSGSKGGAKQEAKSKNSE